MAASVIVRVIARLPAIIDGLLVTLRALAKKYGWLAMLLKDIIDSLDKLRKIVDEIERYFYEQPEQAPVDDIIGDKCKCKTQLLLENKSGKA